MGPQLTIAGDEAFALATELAGLTGDSVKQAVTAAVREKLKVEQERQAWVADIRKLTAGFREGLTEPLSAYDVDDLYDSETGLLAKATGEHLLFNGDDFTQTDITPALA